MDTKITRVLVRSAAMLVLAFLYLPLLIILLYAFNKNVAQSWPIQDWSLKWFSDAWHNQEVRDALLTSLKAASGATAIALLLGSAAAFAVHRFRFFGREAISFVLVLPIALPGIVTGIALASAITYGSDVFGLQYGLFTIILGHATFCIVLVYNNVLARLRRTSSSLIEASQDLGADGWQTFRYVVLPSIRTALVAGGLLAFALSWDEIVVTNFTSGAQNTLPKWIYANVRNPQSRPVVNVVAMAVMLLSFVPVYAAQRLTRHGDGVGTTGL